MMVIGIMGLALSWGCDQAPSLDRGPGVPLALAQHRATTLSDVAYHLSFAIPDRVDEPIRARAVVSFHREANAGDLVLDFTPPSENVLSVAVDGVAVEFQVEHQHIVVADKELGVGPNAVTLEFFAGDGSLNRRPDYLYTLFVPDRARTVFPVFEQPNIKAVFSLELEVPASWRAVSNGLVEEHAVRDDRAVVRFRPTKPISTYLFAFAAGEFAIETAERSGRQFTMYHRETDTTKVRRNREAIFDLHDRAITWLESYTGIPYPFDKFDFALIPSFQYGGMEHPGAVFYRPGSLFLDETATQNSYLGRASLISHETAHMWFGDLVTMDWFNDVWMKEVFANFMAAKMVNPSFPEVDHELRFLLAHYPTAYSVDRTEGANPIRQDLDNLNEAGTLYGAIIYQKAPIVMRHLERMMGAEVFRDGLRTYLAAHPFGNATWPDLITVLNDLSSEDLVLWSRVWVEEPRRPTVQVATHVTDGRYTRFDVVQSDPANRGLVWNQRIDVGLGRGTRVVQTFPVLLSSPTTSVPAAIGEPAADFVLPNSAGVGYANFPLDSASQSYLLSNLGRLDSAQTRAIAWLALWDGMLDERVEPATLLHTALAAIRQEGNELNLQRLLGDMGDLFWTYLRQDVRQSVASEVEQAVWRGVSTAASTTRKSAFFSSYVRIASTESAVNRLQRVWSRTEVIDGLPLSETDYTELAQALAIRGVDGSETILDQQRDQITNPDRRDRFDFVRPALSPDQSIRDAFFATLANPQNRAQEPWVLSALGALHHPIRADQSEKYIRPSLDLIEEIQETGDIFFPARWLDATLGGHNSASAAAIVRRFLNDRDDLPQRLRGKVLQSADQLFRASRIIDAGSGLN